MRQWALGGSGMSAPAGTPVDLQYRCCVHCEDVTPGECPGLHVVPCEQCESGAQTVRPLIWTTSGWRMVL